MSRKKPRDLTNWEWTTLVAAWRYFEYRHTIASATFPEDIVKRFWGKDGAREYEDLVRDKIANQFSNIDHGQNGADDWPPTAPFDDIDGKPWRKFYALMGAGNKEAAE